MWGRALARGVWAGMVWWVWAQEEESECAERAPRAGMRWVYIYIQICIVVHVGACVHAWGCMHMWVHAYVGACMWVHVHLTFGVVHNVLCCAVLHGCMAACVYASRPGSVLACSAHTARRRAAGCGGRRWRDGCWRARSARVCLHLRRLFDHAWTAGGT